MIILILDFFCKACYNGIIEGLFRWLLQKIYTRGENITKMKKLTYIVLALLLAIVCTGCLNNVGATRRDGSESEDISSMTETTEETDNKAQPPTMEDFANYLEDHLDDESYVMYLFIIEEYRKGEMHKVFKYLGFYADGTVIDVDVVANEENPVNSVRVLCKNVTGWFKNGYQSLAEGKYWMIDGKLVFKTTDNENGFVTDYSGSVDESGRLLLDYDGYNYSGFGTYEYVGIVKDGTPTFSKTFSRID